MCRMQAEVSLGHEEQGVVHMAFLCHVGDEMVLGGATCCLTRGLICTRLERDTDASRKGILSTFMSPTR